MDYNELVKKLRAECALPYESIKTMRDAADAIEELAQVREHQRDILMQFGGETGIRQAFERMGDYWRLADKYEELLKAAKAMHTWIFLHTGDEQAAYDECHLSDEMNAALGYRGQMEFHIKKPEEDRGCPPDYNPGFCYGDEDCDACWEGWRKEQEG